MTPEQLEHLTLLCVDFRRQIRWFQRPEFGANAYVNDMLRDIDTLIAMRVECIRESLEA